MKKFIINFNYKGFLFTAKVIAKRSEGRTLVATELLTSELEFLLGDDMLLWLQHDKFYDLVLFKKDRSFEKLQWKVQLQYVDKVQMVDLEAFSLS
jgi:hypothetical protein